MTVGSLVLQKDGTLVLTASGLGGQLFAITEHAEGASHTETPVAGNTASRLLIEDNHIGPSCLRQKDRTLLACLQLLHSRHGADWIVMDGNPRREVSRPRADTRRSIFVAQFSHNTLRHEHATEELRQ